MTQAGLDLPPGVEPPSEIPDALYWLMRVEKWGLKKDVWEEPVYFMEDLGAAMRGRAQFQREQQRIEEYNRRRDDDTDSPGDLFGSLR